MRQVEPDVVAVYPITPQTPIVEEFAQFVSDGLVQTELINVESEHSAMSACVGASSAGARVMTATSSQGLALMAEIVYIAASNRLPIVMAVGNRALSGPINIHCDHSDSMMVRDSGALQIFTENAQEAYDYIIIATRLAEDRRVLLPAMVMQDGFTITHSKEPVVLLEDAGVKEFVGTFQSLHPLLDFEHPTTQGPFAMPDYYFELKRQQIEAQEAAREVFLKTQASFCKRFGRDYVGEVEVFGDEEARIGIVVLGSTAGTAKSVVLEENESGNKPSACVVKPWLFRPFPGQAIADSLESLDAVAVLDRSISFGSYGPLYMEVASALVGRAKRPRLFNYLYGLGGRDITPAHIRQVLAEISSAENVTGGLRYLGLRGE
jgi:pyruvate ferredoxin oxidoreductase alpha subunit